MTRIFKRRRKPILEATGQLVLLFSLIAAVLYGGHWYPSGIPILSVIIKGCAVGALALFVLVCMQNFNHFLLFLALAASVTGDILLALPGDTAFLNGLSAFFGAHVIFIFLYLKNKLPSADLSAARIRLATLLWAFAAVAAYFLYPALGDTIIPVFSYTLVLTIMATTAILSRFSFRLVAIGSILFIISDSLLGARQFLTMPDYTGYFVWGTYYLAQLMMTLGIVLTSDRQTNFGGYRFD